MTYEFLKNIVSPRHMAVAISLLGTKEIPGAKSNDRILQWAKDLGLASIYTNDDTAWCGLFFCHVMKEAGRPVVLETKDKYDYLRALKFATWGKEVKVPAFGDILIFKRPEGGHIGFYVGEDKKAYHVIGGNQGNSVSVTRILKRRLFATRRPEYISFKPEPVLLTSAGKISSNEA